MGVSLGYKFIEKFRGGIQWNMMERKDYFPSISLEIKKENGNLVSLFAQSVTFLLSIK